MSANQREKKFDLSRSKASTGARAYSPSSNGSDPAAPKDNYCNPGGSPRQRKLQASMEGLHLQEPNVNRRGAAGSKWMTANGSNGSGAASGSENQAPPPPLPARMRPKKVLPRSRYLAMDCEMVGVGPEGKESMLARVSIVNRDGEVLMDKHVKPRKEVTDYRTSVSGIRPQDIANGEDFAVVQNEVLKLLRGRILVGHALHYDLNVLNIRHPFYLTRDTSRYLPLCNLISHGGTPSLKRLTMHVLGREIQTGEHNSVEDARAAMAIYNRYAIDWEKYVERKQYEKKQEQQPI